MGFPGTITVSADTYRNLLLDVCGSVYANGFKRMVLLNGHGGNHALNKTVMHQISLENIFVLSVSWWEIVLAEMGKLAITDGDRIGHGGEWETSVQLYLRPQLVLKERMIADRDLTNPFSSEVRSFLGGWGVFAERRRDTEKGTGVMGDPLVATPEKGKAIVEAAVAKLEKIVREYHGLPIREYKQFGSYCP
jgi:creatinine amidohydrolase